MRAGRDRVDPETARLIEARLDRLLAEHAPRRAEAPPTDLPPTAATVPPADSGWSRVAPEASDSSPPVTSPVGWSRRHLTRAHLVVLVGLAVLGLLGAGWLVLRSQPVPLATAVPAPSAVPDPTGAGSASGAPTSSAGAIVVHVLGAVKRPGLVRLPERSRVHDAIRAAGGLRRDADPGELNLAQLVADGQQILIGSERDPAGELRDGAPGGAGDGASQGQGGGSSRGPTVDLNVASAAQLEELPGVGPVTAGKIIAWRDEHGRFTRVEELQEVAGIGPKTYAEIAPHCRV